jgi:phosphoglucosamine mutase
MDLSQAAAQVLSRSSGHKTRPVAVVGRDPRASGEFLEAAVVAGLAGTGVDVLRLGVLPTPGVAFLAGALAADFGVVISASHNPAEDNGIKFFGPGGVKLPDAVEDEIEAVLASDRPVKPLEFGRVTDASSEHARYVDYLLGTLPHDQARPLNGMKVVVDCAHGAAYAIAPQVPRSSRSVPSPTA